MYTHTHSLTHKHARTHTYTHTQADPRDGDAEITVTRGLGNFNLEPGFTSQPHVSDPIDLCAESSEFVVSEN